MSEQQVPEWAKGEGWKFLSGKYALREGAVSIWDDGLLMWKGSYHQFPTPEDARYIADCLIAGKVLPHPDDEITRDLIIEFRDAYIDPDLPSEEKWLKFNELMDWLAPDPVTVPLIPQLDTKKPL